MARKITEQKKSQQGKATEKTENEKKNVLNNDKKKQTKKLSNSHNNLRH